MKDPRDLLLSRSSFPLYNEDEVIPQFHERLSRVLDALPVSAEILYVNDGSSDGSWRLLEDLRGRDPRVALIDLSRNFGKEVAMSAGLDHARGDAVVIIDADLQDPPELITELVAEWLKGFDVVNAKRRARDGETAFRGDHGFYRIMRWVSGENPRMSEIIGS
jgi:glycosyltransferase involved in cell wall biosynthesis